MYTIREYEPKTEADYLPLIKVHDAAWPDEPSEPNVWHFRDSRWPQDKLYIRFVGMVQKGSRASLQLNEQEG